MWWLSLWARSPVHWLVYEEGYAWSGASLIWMCMNRNTASTILPDVLTKRRIRLSAAFRWQQKVFRRKKVVKPCEFWLFLRSAIRSIHILSSSEGVVHEREVLEYFCRCQDAVWHFAWPHEPVCKNGWIDKNGRVYIIFTIDEAKMALNCAEQKAIKLLSELEKKAGLIERKRQVWESPTWSMWRTLSLLWIHNSWIVIFTILEVFFSKFFIFLHFFRNYTSDWCEWT